MSMEKIGLLMIVITAAAMVALSGVVNYAIAVQALEHAGRAVGVLLW